MNIPEERYDLKTAAAWILGHSRRTGVPSLPASVIRKKTQDCSDEELRLIVDAGLAAKLKLYPFKSGANTLVRTRRTLGFLHSVSFETLLDVGSGRGVFLIPFLKEFPSVRVTSIDILEPRVTFLNELADGGFDRLRAVRENVCDQPFPDSSFDVVTMLEVLEHIPDVDKAVAAAVKMAKRFVAVSVPSKPDDNPEHIHLLTKNYLTELFGAAGCTRLNFDGVEGHLFMVAAIDK